MCLSLINSAVRRRPFCSCNRSKTDLCVSAFHRVIEAWRGRGGPEDNRALGSKETGYSMIQRQPSHTHTDRDTAGVLLLRSSGVGRVTGECTEKCIQRRCYIGGRVCRWWIRIKARAAWEEEWRFPGLDVNLNSGTVTRKYSFSFRVCLPSSGNLLVARKCWNVFKRKNEKRSFRGLYISVLAKDVNDTFIDNCYVLIWWWQRSVVNSGSAGGFGTSRSSRAPRPPRTWHTGRKGKYFIQKKTVSRVLFVEKYHSVALLIHADFYSDFYLSFWVEYHQLQDELSWHFLHTLYIDSRLWSSISFTRSQLKWKQHAQSDIIDPTWCICFVGICVMEQQMEAPGLTFPARSWIRDCSLISKHKLIAGR